MSNMTESSQQPKRAEISLIMWERVLLYGALLGYSTMGLFSFIQSAMAAKEATELNSFYMKVVSKRLVQQGLTHGEINPDQLEQSFKAEFPGDVARKRGFWKVNYIVYEGKGGVSLVFNEDGKEVTMVAHGYINDDEGKR